MSTVTKLQPARTAPVAFASAAPVQMARLVRRGESGWRVSLGGQEVEIAADPEVDPALLEEVCHRGGRVIVDAGEEVVIAGVLQTARALQVDRDGKVNAEVEEVSLFARRKIVLRAPGAWLQVAEKQVEQYAKRVLTRARDVAQILAPKIKLN